MRDLDALVRPGSVAVVGANDDCDTFGGRVWRYLERYTTLDRMAVNIRPDALKDGSVARSLRELPQVPDAVVLATPCGTIKGLVSEAAAIGVKAAIVFSQVATETRPELARIVDEGAMTLLGPGSLGLINANEGVVLSSSVSLEWAPRPGPLALVVQSGALMGVLHARAAEQGIGLGLCVATGSQLQVRVEDLLAALGNDGDYLAVGAHLEDVDVELFSRAAESLARAGRKLIVLKGGMSAAGSVAAAGHSGALAGDGRAFESLARELGVTVASDPTELLACMQAATIRGRSWCLATVSGGLATIAADIASVAGLSLAEPNPGLELFPPGNDRLEHSNPVDLDAVPMTTEQTVAAVELLAKDPSSDGVVLVLNDKPDLDGLLGRLSLLDEATRQRLHLCAECSGQYDYAWRAWVEEGGTYSKGLACFVRALATTRETREQDNAGLAVQGRLMSAVAAHALLAEAGIPTLALLEIPNLEALELAVSDLKLPLVLKLADVEHRTAKEVVTVASRVDARREYLRLSEIGTVVAQPVARPGLEFYVGITVDQVFGPLFLIGAGGPALEAERDVSISLGLPDRGAIRRCIGETVAGHWLQSSLGSRMVDLGLLEDVALKASALARKMTDSLIALDLNPVVLSPSGATVIDAKVHVRKPRLNAG
jgi:acyl-CoA synthetase (NDP forming)